MPEPLRMGLTDLLGHVMEEAADGRPAILQLIPVANSAGAWLLAHRRTEIRWKRRINDSDRVFIAHGALRISIDD